MKELAGRTPAQLLDLSDELRLAKCTMDDVSMMYDMTKKAYELADEGSEQQAAALNATIQVGAMVREVAEEIGCVAGRAAGAMAAARHFIGVQNVGLLVAQMITIVNDEVKSPEAQRRIAQRLSEVHIPDNGNRGTTITPDMEAAQMDDSIPRIAYIQEEDVA